MPDYSETPEILKHFLNLRPALKHLKTSFVKSKKYFFLKIFSLGCCPTENWVAVGLEDNNVQVIQTF